MNTKRLVLLSFALSVAVFTCFTWPLPRYGVRGIPSSSQNIERAARRRMIVGDHLRLLYNFWLVSEMATGEIPFLHNVYEANEGDDSARYEPRHYYVPFSVAFALLSWAVGRAAAYNLTLLLSVWMALLFTVLLVRRYVRGDPWSMLPATVGILLPYHWVCLLGGSPTGLAMMWVPVSLLGLDIAVRDEKLAGGLLAGVALLFARLCDTHVFFFAGLLAPCWCLVALAMKGRGSRRNGERWLRTAWALLPGFLLSLFAVVYRFWRGRDFVLARADAARTFLQLVDASPQARHLFRWRGSGVAGHAYVGFVLPILVVAGTALLVARSRRSREERRNTRVACLLCGILVLIVCLALGPNGPLGGVVFRAFRRLVPPYTMIREPVRIFCLVPPLVAVLTALLLNRLRRYRPNSRAPRLACLAVMLLFLGEYGLQVRPTVCVLAPEQEAYAAVARHARSSGRVGRILVLPIWPGDVSWSSIAQHFISLYRLRMLNAYSDIVPRGYRRNVYARFESMNRGDVTDAQLDGLQRRGIHYIVLHEDAFPEAVSPFSVWATLRSLLQHPRLELMAQAEAVWAFRVLSQRAQRERIGTGWTTFSSARSWRAAACPSAGARLVKEGATRHAELKGEASFLETPPAAVGNAPGLRYLVCARGRGRVEATVHQAGVAVSRTVLEIGSETWAWHEVPIGRPAGRSGVAVRLERPRGDVAVASFILCAGTWAPPRGPGGIDVPGTSFFHAGYTDSRDGSVTLRADTDPDDVVFYGPKLPLPAGEYEVRMTFSSPGEKGLEIGRCFVMAGAERRADAAVRVGEKAVCSLPLRQALPVSFAFRFARAADVTIHRVSFIRNE